MQMIIYMHALKQMIVFINTVHIEIFYHLISDGTKFAPVHKFISKLKIIHKFQLPAITTDCHNHSQYSKEST